jgi:hypothetical protein
MAATDTLPAKKKGPKTPVRNRFFYGKLMSDYHFQLETLYFNDHRHLHNRLISGYGVVCGLDVQPAPGGLGIVVCSGYAIDRWGREIIVPEQTAPIPILPYLIPPPDKPGGYLPPDRQVGYGHRPGRKPENEDRMVQVMLCYHECESDPTPVMAGECGTVEECTPGAIRERYRITFKEGPASRVPLECRIPDLLYNGRLDYGAVVKWVSTDKGCREPAADPCIPLANVRLPAGEDRCDEERIDITVRPIVYTSDLLFEILLSLLIEERGDDRREK